MPVSAGLFFLVANHFGARRILSFEGLALEHGATMRRWLGAGCILALMCVCILPDKAFSQTSASGDKTADTKAAKKREKTAAADSKSRTSPKAKAHPASHPAAEKHPKSNAAVAAHSDKSKHPSSGKTGKSKTGKSKTGKRKTTARGQQKIDPMRAQAIQEALIREHYLTGQAAGTWNQASEDAMRRYQAEHGWQSKTVPDSRALISLGLGPSHDHLLNPESAMTTGPSAPRASTLTPTSHSADPGAKLSTNPAVPAESTPAAASDKNAPKPQ